MVCESCGEKPKNTAKDFTKAVIEINNPEALVLLRKVVIPTSMGDEESVPPAIGKYRNVLLQYEANDHIYLYSSDGIPTAITANIPQEILDSIAELEATDVVLQQEIDDLKNSPDVVDIVPTYADLQAYDTSKLGDNDIIRVLQDEQHDGQSTYYRWNATTSSWTYIGAVGDYYTKGQVDTLLTGKQNTLTAGANVQISPENVISATDTTYTHFTGATASTDGTAGLVPAPVAGDDTKFLSGDGTWGTPAGTTYTAGTNVQISAQNVISATDTTYSNFVGTDGQTAGTAGLVPAPATTDAGKYLKADGTWDTVNAGPTVVQSTGTSTADVMSQKAVTDELYPQYSAHSKGVIGIGDYNSIANYGGTKIGIGHVTLGNSSAYSVAINGGDAGGVVNAISALGIWAGNGGTVTGHSGIAIGSGASVSAAGGVAIGRDSSATSQGEFNIGSSSASYGYNNTNYRLISGVHDGVNAHDAATVGQLTAYSVVSGAGAPTTSTVAQYVGQFYYDTTNDGYYYCTAITAQGTTPETYSYTWTALSTGGSGPTVVQTTGTSTTSVMSQDATSSMVFADPGTNTKIKIGYNTDVPGNNGIVIGTGAYNANNCTNNIAIGNSAHASATNTYDCVAIGGLSNVQKHSAIAIGRSAEANGQGAIALGAYSSATRNGEINVGTSWGATGFNSTNYRLISGVHDGQNAHDAATVGQLDGRVIQNAGAPTTSTVGTVGQLLEDTTNGKLYICTDAANPYVWEEVGAGGGGTTEIEYVNCTLTGATATGFTLSADKTATQVKALVESGKEVIYKFVNSVSAGSVLAGTYEFSVLYAGTNTSVDVVTGYGMTSTYGSQTQDVYTFIHTSSAVTVTAGTIPTVNDATLTIQKNGTTVQTFTANASSNATANIEVPTITMTTTDPGEGSALAADNFVAVYGGDPIIMDYSTSEINTGATWINGAPIYKKTVNFGALPNATSKDVAHGISNLERVVKIEGYAYRSSDDTNFPIPFASENTGASIGVSTTSTNISIGTGIDRSNVTECYVTLYYTKSS